MQSGDSAGNPRARKVLALWVDPWVDKNGIFDIDHPENRDDQYFMIRRLKARLFDLGWDMQTQDVLQNNGVTPDAVLFMDVPYRNVASMLGPWAGHVQRLFSFALESPIVKPYVWDADRHKQFEKVITWHSDYIARPGYADIRVPNKIPKDIVLKRDISAKRKLCVMIAGNKRPRITSPLELYTKRLDCIRWFEANHLEDFDLYGVGWNDATVRFSWRLRRLGLMKFVNAIVGVEKRPSYRGPVKEKMPVLEQYRFNIAFENARDIPGYITEKLFDSFLGSTVPVYWGAPDVAKFVPKDCYIDFAEYGNYPALYERLSTMTNEEYLGYIDRIEAYLRGPGADPFRAEVVAETIAGQIAG